MIEELEDKVTALTSRWMSLISGDHHKDRDCHFEIARKWSYGDKYSWRVEHNGYLINPVTIVCSSYKLALECLIKRLEHEIKNYENCPH